MERYRFYCAQKITLPKKIIPIVFALLQLIHMIESDKSSTLDKIVKFRLGCWNGFTDHHFDLQKVFDHVSNDHKNESICIYNSSKREILNLNGYKERIVRGLDRWELKTKKWGSDIRVSNIISYADTLNLSGSYAISMTDAPIWSFNELDSIGYPIIQFARHKSDSKAILFPLDFRYMGVGSVNLPKSVNDIDVPFRMKKDVAIWRGRLSGTIRRFGRTVHIQNIIHSLLSASTENQFIEILNCHSYNPRIQLCKLFQKTPDVDVAIYDPNGLHPNANTLFSQSEFIKRFIGNKLSIKEQLKYRYIICLPGNDYPSGLYWALVSNSIVLMPEPQWFTALDFDLKPWIHYVPILENFSDLLDKINWCRNNDNEVQSIIANAKHYCSIVSDCNLRDQADYLVMKALEKIIRPKATPKKMSFSTDTNLSKIMWSDSKLIF
jgi:hypothetical protein